MQSFKVDYADDDDKIVTKYFGDDRARAMATARRISRKGLLTYMVRAARPSDDFNANYQDTGHVVFSNGVIVDRDGLTEAV